jgi:LysR family transcriptional activator of nhaA
MVLTEAGKAVFRYADEVFPHGQELLDELRGAPPRGGGRLTVGIGDGVPKLEARRLLLPALSQAEAPILVCVQDHVAALVAKLLTFELDLVLADEPVSAEGGPALVSRLLSSGDVSFFGAPELLGALTGPFPTCLQSAPLLLPGNRTALRWELQRWLDALHLVPRIVAEIEDSALMKAMGQAGAGLFVAPSTLRAVVETSYGVGVVGRASGLRSSVYALTVERRRPHPAVAALLAAL